MKVYDLEIDYLTEGDAEISERRTIKDFDLDYAIEQARELHPSVFRIRQIMPDRTLRVVWLAKGQD